MPRKKASQSALRQSALDLCNFIAVSPSPFHVVANCVLELTGAGFERLSEAEAWSLRPHGRYLVTRNDSSIAAFILGDGPMEDTGLRIIGAHTDSPTFRLKPVPGIERQGYVQLGVEVYGGPILATWLDRDLGLAGRVLLSTPEKRRNRAVSGRGPGRGAAIPSALESRLVLIDRPVARIPHVAIHLDREVNEKGLLLNKENHLPPILGLGQDWDFHKWLGREMGVDPDRILDHELVLFDLTLPRLAGMNQEFLVSARLDNLGSSHAALRALLNSAEEKHEASRVIVLYDNEEIGSATRQGAAGPFLSDLIERMVAAMVSGNGPGRSGGARSWDPQLLQRVRARSQFVSADMAHAVHPNYPERHEGRHLPKLNGGPVIKYNANARYATDAATGAMFYKLCRDAGIPVQKYVNRADFPCGSTIGPVVAARLGVPAVDIGSPMLSMHSCRETAGSEDPGHMIRAMGRFLTQ